MNALTRGLLGFASGAVGGYTNYMMADLQSRRQAELEEARDLRRHSLNMAKAEQDRTWKKEDTADTRAYQEKVLAEQRAYEEGKADKVINKDFYMKDTDGKKRYLTQGELYKMSTDPAKQHLIYKDEMRHKQSVLAARTAVGSGSGGLLDEAGPENPFKTSKDAIQYIKDMDDWTINQDKPLTREQRVLLDYAKSRASIPTALYGEGDFGIHWGKGDIGKPGQAARAATPPTKSQNTKQTQVRAQAEYDRLQKLIDSQYWSNAKKAKARKDLDRDFAAYNR